MEQENVWIYFKEYNQIEALLAPERFPRKPDLGPMGAYGAVS